MHELSIAESLLEIVQEEGRKHGVSKVTRVCVRIGGLSNIVPEALSFSFEVIAENTIAEGAVLDIETVLAMGRCPTCGIDFEMDRGSFLCPECGGMASAVISGQELEIAHIEAE
jgi:hydrogenase nickel incorporation protein HypA/HybF